MSLQCYHIHMYIQYISTYVHTVHMYIHTYVRMYVHIYRISGNIGDIFNLAVWWSGSKSPNFYHQIYIDQLCFVLAVQPPNLISANISGYTVGTQTIVLYSTVVHAVKVEKVMNILNSVPTSFHPIVNMLLKKSTGKGDVHTITYTCIVIIYIRTYMC